MKQYLIKVFPYILLVLIFLGAGEWMLYQSGELRPIRQIVKEQIQSGQPSHYQKGLFPSNYHIYLYEHLKQRQVDIVVIGESITHQFQARMFAPKEAAFFNASKIFRSMDDLEMIINQIISGELHKPQLIIMGLDPAYLKSTATDMSFWKKDSRDPVLNINGHFHAVKMAIHQLRAKKKKENDPIIEPQSFGLFGQQGKGRRQDGSYDNVDIHKEYDDNPIYVERNKLKEILRKRQYGFEPPLVLDDQLINRFLALLGKLKEHNIDVVFYAQQFADDFMQEAEQDEAFMVLWNQFIDLSEDLESQGYLIISPGTPADIGLDDRYMRDANHAGEVMTAIQLLNLVEKKGAQIPALRDIDLEHLRQLIEHKKSEMEL